MQPCFAAWLQHVLQAGVWQWREYSCKLLTQGTEMFSPVKAQRLSWAWCPALPARSTVVCRIMMVLVLLVLLFNMQCCIGIASRVASMLTSHKDIQVTPHTPPRRTSDCRGNCFKQCSAGNWSAACGF
jgi:hypothetical protein